MKKCKKCGSSYSDSKKFCGKCGTKLSDFTRITRTNPNIMKNKFVIGGISVGIILVAFIMLWATPYATTVTQVEIADNSKNEQSEVISSGAGSPSQYEPSIQKQVACRYVQEPYTVQVPYTYMDQVPYYYSYKYLTSNGKCEHLFDFSKGEYVFASLDVANTENTGGAFSVDFSFRTLEGTTTETVSYYVNSHSAATFSKIFDNVVGQDVECSYVVNGPGETRYNQVERVGYNDEVRYNTVEVCE